MEDAQGLTAGGRPWLGWRSWMRRRSSCQTKKLRTILALGSNNMRLGFFTDVQFVDIAAAAVFVWLRAGRLTQLAALLRLQPFERLQLRLGHSGY
mmetsp:Transcript_137958/g.275028  ORF Transcript_137958/g.275028 Transcript_137958/m.275028 type:complete len:95 (+) Transcript_137958:469-753(+)